MGNKLATEILHELKLQAKKWFIAFIIMFIIWVVTIGVVVVYCL